MSGIFFYWSGKNVSALEMFEQDKWKVIFFFSILFGESYSASNRTEVSLHGFVFSSEEVLGTAFLMWTKQKSCYKEKSSCMKKE